MDRTKLEAALRRLEDEKFGRRFKLTGDDAAVFGAWFRWMRDAEILCSQTRGEQEQPEPVAVIEAVPEDGKHREA